MAQFTKANSDFKPVFHQDASSYTNGGLNAYTTGEAVNLQGPKLQFGIVTFTGEATAALPGADLANSSSQQSKADQQLRSIEMDSSGGADANVLNLALFPTEGWEFHKRWRLRRSINSGSRICSNNFMLTGVTFDSM